MQWDKHNIGGNWKGVMVFIFPEGDVYVSDDTIVK